MTNFYIFTHKNFNIVQNLKGNYKIITDGTELKGTYPYEILKADNELQPMKRCYSELVQMYNVYKNDTDSDYIGINHYRRYFDVQFHEEVNEEILPMKMAFDGRQQYAACHNVKDLDECIEIIKNKYGYNTDISDGIYPCNMFVLTREHFKAYCSFLFDILQEYTIRHNFKTDEDVRKYVSAWSTNVDYQSRLYGFLAERIGTIWFNNNCHNIRHSQILLNNLS